MNEVKLLDQFCLHDGTELGRVWGCEAVGWAATPKASEGGTHCDVDLDGLAFLEA